MGQHWGFEIGIRCELCKPHPSEHGADVGKISCLLGPMDASNLSCACASHCHGHPLVGHNPTYSLSHKNTKHYSFKLYLVVFDREEQDVTKLGYACTKHLLFKSYFLFVAGNQELTRLFFPRLLFSRDFPGTRVLT